MPILEMKSAKQTGTKESDEWVSELSSGGIERFGSGGVAAAALDRTLADSDGVERFERLFQAAPRVPILILRGADAEDRARKIVQRGAQECQIKNQAYRYRLGGRCAR
jgi:DNA-binding NarL/FixJ family response regulator